MTSYDNSRVSGSRCLKSFARNDANIGQVAVFLGIVGAIADHEHVGDHKADEVDRELDFTLQNHAALPANFTATWNEIGRAHV